MSKLATFHDLKDKSIFVTGGGFEIGASLAERQLELWADPQALASHLEKQCLKKHLSPRDIVDATLFLASDTSRVMTGQAMVVDGGVVFAG